MAIANEEEILEFWSDIMRCDGYHAENIKLSDSVKAAENLAKYYGMFGDRHSGDSGDVIIVANIAGKDNAVQS